MHSLGGLLETALAIISIATLAGLGLMRGDTIRLRENLKDAREEISDKDRRLTEAEAQIDKQATQIRGQAHDLEALGRVVTGEAHWIAIGEKLDNHHREAKAHWENDERLLGDISRRLGGATT